MIDDRSSKSAPFTTILAWGLWFALVAGLSQAAAITAARVVTQRLIWATPEVVWLAPAANAVVLAIVASIVWLLMRGRNRSSTLAVASGIFLFLSLIGHLLRVPRLHPLAVIFLAAGSAVQGARMLRDRYEGFQWVVKRTLPVLMAICIVLGLGIYVRREFRSRQAESRLPAATAGAPNVIMIVLDTVRAENLSFQGYKRPTAPQLEKFAQTAAVFDHAFSTAPWTLPSHGSFFTGKHPHDLSANWLTPLDDAYPTLSEAFSARGYMTVGFVANLIYATAESGLNRGFARYSDFPLSVTLAVRESWLTRALTRPLRASFGDFNSMVRKPAADVNAEFLTWLNARPGRPFFAFLNYFDAHQPYLPPAPFDNKFRRNAGREYLNKEAETWSPEEIEQARDAYDGTIAYLDHQIGLLLQTLKAQNLLDNTVIVITSDHGEQLGEHKLFDHGNSLYSPLLHVPLMISFPPRIPQGVRVSDAVSLVDLPATILDLANAGTKELTIPGRSWSGYWDPEGERPKQVPVLAEISKTINMLPWMPASKGDMQSVVINRMHYIRSEKGPEELYDMEHDAAEMHNLASRAEYRGVLEDARRALQDVLKNPVVSAKKEIEVDRN
jgi:arylsulfatase A-like enzyme